MAVEVGHEALPDAVRARLADGSIRRVLVIGQGTGRSTYACTNHRATANTSASGRCCASTDGGTYACAAGGALSSGCATARQGQGQRRDGTQGQATRDVQ